MEILQSDYRDKQVKKVKHFSNEKSETYESTKSRIQHFGLHSAISIFAFLVFFYPDLLAELISIIVAFSYVVHKTPQEFMGSFKGTRKRDPQTVKLLLKELNLLTSPTELSRSSENQRHMKIDGIKALLFSSSTDKLSNT